MAYPVAPYVGVPFGGIYSFGTILFDPHSPLDNFHLEWISATATMPDNAFPIDLYGNGPTPLSAPTATWQALLLADYTDHTTSTYAQVEDKFNAILSVLRTSGGGVNTLTVNDARGAHWHCRARIKTIEAAPVTGKNSTHYIAKITFLLLSDFVTG